MIYIVIFFIQMLPTLNIIIQTCHKYHTHLTYYNTNMSYIHQISHTPYTLEYKHVTNITTPYIIIIQTCRTYTKYHTHLPYYNTNMSYIHQISHAPSTLEYKHVIHTQPTFNIFIQIQTSISTHLYHFYTNIDINQHTPLTFLYKYRHQSAHTFNIFIRSYKERLFAFSFRNNVSKSYENSHIRIHNTNTHIRIHNIHQNT